MKKTPWFSVSTPPVRDGAYERDHEDDGGTCFQFWNGRWWGLVSVNPTDARQSYPHRSLYQTGKWRGILKGTK